MRKGTMMVALAALLVAIFATAAYAVVVEGTSGNDNLDDPNATANDQLYGNRGNDNVDGDAGGTDNDADTLAGNRGSDWVSGVDGDTRDYVAGNRGKNDTCYLDYNSSTDAADTQGGGCETAVYD